tara:strand:- start:425 stop:775 length:351 start_codon:yes stop_codon:yes gene_type:complete
LINDKFFTTPLGTKQKEKKENYAEKQFHKINLTKIEIKNFVQNAGFVVKKIDEIENMPLLYKFKIFRDRKHRKFDENISRKDGYLLNPIGSFIQLILRSMFRNQFCNLYVVIAEKY